MTNNDRSLLRQMIQAGRFNGAIYDLLCEDNIERSKELVEKMGDKWCCHPANSAKRLDVPMDLLKQHQSRILKGKR